MQSKHKHIETIQSPSGRLALSISSFEDVFYYELSDQSGRTRIAPSKMKLFGNGGNLIAAVGDIDIQTSTTDETWEQPWGEQRIVRNNYNEVSVNSPLFTIRLRLFDDSIGFRYELRGEGPLVIDSEETEFHIDTKSRVWWIPALGGNHYEHLYRNSPLQEIDTAHTPLTIELSDGTYAAIHEAALYDYGSMNLIYSEGSLVSSITPRLDGTAAHVDFPFMTPWRTVVFSETPYDLGLSRTMLNLNEPSKIQDTSWIEPTKFMGIWWAMFIGYYTWAYGENHGATTGNALRYINAAKQLGISALLIEGWNETWEGDWTKNGEKMDHMQPTPDFDLHAVTSHAKRQGIDIVGHHETSGNISHYEWELPEAYDYYKVYGVRYIKTGYVSSRLNTGDFHSSQVGVVHYQKTVELAAERGIMLNIHEPVKGTGTERTWPNLLSREGVMGQEYEGGAISPEHATVLPYTRALAGPFDYTPGLFNLNRTRRKVTSTLARQLAFYVTMYSPMMMVADLPEHYDGHPAFAFIKDVPVNWEYTVPLAGEIGDYYVVARKDRYSDDWYVGAVTDEVSREVTVPLHFLDGHRTYEAIIYRDAHDTDWESNPERYEIEARKVQNTDSLSLVMAAGGGFAIRLRLDGENNKPYPDFYA